MNLLVGLFLFQWWSAGPLSFQSHESVTPEGGPVFNRIRHFSPPGKEVWMMQQSQDGGKNWDRLAISVEKGKARYYQLAPGPLEWQEGLPEIPNKVSCFLCHPNGPRAIRPVSGTPWTERAKAWAWNVRIKSYGRVLLSPVHDQRDPFLEVPVRRRALADNAPLMVKTCVLCHKESGLFARGTLLRQHFLSIQFLREHGHMPPLGIKLSAEEEREIQDFVAGF